MMGAGKTTVGRELAGRLGWAFLDSDAMVEASTGSTVPELFADRGEAGVPGRGVPGAGRGRWPVPAPVVVSAAGGVVLAAENRALLAGRHRGVAAGRPGARWPPGWAPAPAGPCSTTTRPARWPPSTRSAVPSTRRWPTWSSTSTTSTRRRWPTGSWPPPRFARSAAVTDGRARRPGRPLLRGAGGRRASATSWPAVVADDGAAARRAVVVTQEGIGVEVDPGLPFEVVTVPDGESAKSLGQVEDLCRRFARSGLSRADVVVAVGGGVVTDLAGFAAASFHRGHGLRERGHVAAGPGGRGHRRARPASTCPRARTWSAPSGSPSAVLCDTETLATLPPREWASGRGEVAKYALLGIDTDARRPRRPPTCRSTSRWPGARPSRPTWWPPTSARATGGCCSTTGTPWPTPSRPSAFDDDGTDLRHGEAVAVGLVFAALLARRLGRIDDARVAHHRAVVGAFDLAVDLPAGRRRPTQLLGFMGRDKKAHGRPDLRARRPRRGRGRPWHRPGRRGRYPCGHGVERPACA